MLSYRHTSRGSLDSTCISLGWGRGRGVDLAEVKASTRLSPIGAV